MPKFIIMMNENVKYAKNAKTFSHHLFTEKMQIKQKTIKQTHGNEHNVKMQNARKYLSLYHIGKNDII